MARRSRSTGPRRLDSDASLLARRDSDSFNELYDRHAEKLLRFFVRRTGCPETAADLTAETFAEVFTSRRRFHDVGAPGLAWIFTIARRQLNRFIRREVVADRARRRLGIEPVELSTVDIERIAALADALGQRAELVAALASLPTAQARAVELRVVHELAYPEVAGRLGCSEGAARVRVSRGLTRLADALEAP